MKTLRNLRFSNLIVWINIKLQIPRDHRTPLPIPSLIHRASHKIFAFPRSAFHHTKALSQSTPMAHSPPCICFDWYKNIDSGIASSNTSILFEYQSNTDFEAFFAELRQSGVPSRRRKKRENLHEIRINFHRNRFNHEIKLLSSSTSAGIAIGSIAIKRESERMSD